MNLAPLGLFESRPRLFGRSAAVLGFVAAAFACGTGTGQGSGLRDTGGSGANGSGANGSGANGSGASSSGAANGSGASNGSGATGPDIDLDAGNDGPKVGEGIEDKCDQIDNDNNGIVDDVDVGHDGVCDCLNVATIGRLGIWGTGNVFNDWLNSRGPTAAANLDDQVLTAELLEPYQIIVILNVSDVSFDYGDPPTNYPAKSHVYSAEEVAALEAWVRAGGGLMTTSGYTDVMTQEIVNVNRLLAPFGLSYSTATKDQNVVGEITDFETHDMTEGVTTLHAGVGIAPVEASISQTVAHDPTGLVALTASQIDDGRVAMWGDEWITYDADWTGHPEWQVEEFWVNVLKWLSPPAVCQVPKMIK